MNACVGSVVGEMLSRLSGRSRLCNVHVLAARESFTGDVLAAMAQGPRLIREAKPVSA